MASKTKGELISDIELRLTQGKPSDDVEIEHDQIAKWLDDAANMLLADQIAKQLAKGEDINTAYLYKSSYLAPTAEPINEVNDSVERYKIDISSLDIMPLRGYSRDYGVVRVLDEDNEIITNVTHDDTDYTRFLWFSKATCKRPHWYRESGEIYLDGLDANSAQVKKFRVFYVKPIDSSGLASTAPYPLGDDLISMVVSVAYEIGVTQFSTGIKDLENDGKSTEYELRSLYDRR